MINSSGNHFFGKDIIKKHNDLIKLIAFSTFHYCMLDIAFIVKK